MILLYLFLFLTIYSLTPRMEKGAIIRSRLNRLQAAKPIPLQPNHPKAFAILFQIESMVSTSIVWQSWLEDAYQWIHAIGLEDWNVSTNESEVLRTFVHHNFYVKPSFIKSNVPPILRDSLVPSPLPCKWGPTNPCLYRLLEYSLEACPECGYFTIVSNNHLPLKPFKVLYEEFLNDTRARVRISHLAFGQKKPFLPKISAWKALPRKWVEVAVQDWESWLPGQWTVDHDIGVSAAPDEGQILDPVYKEFGEDLFDMITIGNLTEEQNPNLRSLHILDCWDNNCCPGCKKANRRVPHLYSVIEEKLLRSWIDDPKLWFFRKATDDTRVKYEGSKRYEPVYTYIENKFLYVHSTWRPEKEFPHRVPDLQRSSHNWVDVVNSLSEHEALLSKEEARKLVDHAKCGP